MANDNNITIKFKGDTSDLENATNKLADNIGDKLGDKVEGTLDSVNDKLDETSNQFDKANDSLESIKASEVADGIAEIGDKFVELGNNAIDTASEYHSAFDKLATQLGATGDEADSLKGHFDAIFESGITDNYDEVAEAISQVKTNLKGVTEENLEPLTEQAMRLSKNFGGDMNENLRGVNALMESFGLDADTAMGLLVEGTQNGLDKTGELGDNLAEYAPLFQDNGFSAQEMFTVLQAGLDSGAYNLDRVNDLVKEFGIRVKDGTTKDALKDLGGSWSKIYDDWKKSGGNVSDLMSTITTEIGKVSDSNERARLTALLFGTQGEDSGFKVVEAMGKAKEGIDTTKGAYSEASAEMASKKLLDPTDAEKYQGALNKLKNTLVPLGTQLMTMLTPVIEFVGKLVDGFSKLPKPVKEFVALFGGITAVVALLAPVIVAITTLGSTFVGVGLAIVGAVAGVITIATALYDHWGEIVEGLKGLWNGVKEWFIGLWNGFTETVSTVWEGITTYLSGVFERIKEVFSVAWEAIKNVVSTVWDAIYQVIYNAMYVIATIIGTIIEIWKNTVGVAMSWIFDKIKGIWDNIYNAIKPILDTISNAISNAWNKVKTVTSNVFNTVKNFLVTTWNNIKTNVTNVANALKDAISQIWENIKTKASTVWNATKEAVMKPINELKQKATSTWNSLKETASTVWTNIKEAMTKPISDAWGVIKKAIDKIKGLFNFSWELPHIKLPHFSIKGEFNPLKGQLPHIGVDWYKKGGVFNKASIIGVGEERGVSEAVLPLKDSVLGKIGAMIANTMDSGTVSNNNSSNITINVGSVDSKQRINELASTIEQVMTRNTNRRQSAFN